jgi:MFS family permease
VSSIGGLVRPTLTSLITQATPREEQGVVLGLTQSLNSVSMIVAPPLGGLMIEHGWLTAWGLTASAVVVVGLMLASGSPDELGVNSSPVSTPAR